MVGSIAYDSVTSPVGNVEDALGGSAVYRNSKSFSWQLPGFGENRIGWSRQ